jgi:hypothetical protein
MAQTNSASSPFDFTKKSTKTIQATTDFLTHMCSEQELTTLLDEESSREKAPHKFVPLPKVVDVLQANEMEKRRESQLARASIPDPIREMEMIESKIAEMDRFECEAIGGKPNVMPSTITIVNPFRKSSYQPPPPKSKKHFYTPIGALRTIPNGENPDYKGTEEFFFYPSLSYRASDGSTKHWQQFSLVTLAKEDDEYVIAGAVKRMSNDNYLLLVEKKKELNLRKIYPKRIAICTALENSNPMSDAEKEKLRNDLEDWIHRKSFGDYVGNSPGDVEKSIAHSKELKKPAPKTKTKSAPKTKTKSAPKLKKQAKAVLKEKKPRSRAKVQKAMETDMDVDSEYSSSEETSAHAPEDCEPAPSKRRARHSSDEGDHLLFEVALDSLDLARTAIEGAIGLVSRDHKRVKK